MTEATLKIGKQTLEILDRLTKLRELFEVDKSGKSQITSLRLSAGNQHRDIIFYKPLEERVSDIKDDEIKIISENFTKQLEMQMKLMETLVVSTLEDVSTVFKNQKIVRDEQED